MLLRFLPGVVLASLVVAAVPAAAQTTTPDMTITIPDLPPGPVRINAGQTHSISFTVNVDTGGFVCPNGGTIMIDVAVTNAGAAPPGVTPSVDPLNITIDIPAGAPGVLPDPAPTPRVNSSTSVTLRVATTAASSGTFPATVTASYAGGAPAADPVPCNGDIPQSSGTATHQVQITGTGGAGNTTTPGTTPPGTPPGPGGTGNNTTTPPPAPAPSRGLPGFEPMLLAGALAAAAAFTVRRRGA